MPPFEVKSYLISQGGWEKGSKRDETVYRRIAHTPIDGPDSIAYTESLTPATLTLAGREEFGFSYTASSLPPTESRGGIIHFSATWIWNGTCYELLRLLPNHRSRGTPVLTCVPNFNSETRSGLPVLSWTVSRQGNVWDIPLRLDERTLREQMLSDAMFRRKEALPQQYPQP